MSTNIDRGWTFYRDNAKAWIELHSADVYLDTSYDQTIRMERFPWELPFTCDGVGGWINGFPDSVRFSAADKATGLRFRWCVNIICRHKDGIVVDVPVIAALIAKCATPEQSAALSGALDDLRNVIDEQLAEREQWVATMRLMRADLMLARGVSM